MPDEPLGTVTLTGSAQLVFTVGFYKGRQYASVRKFVSTAKYSGPTQSGLALPGEVLVGLTEAIERLQADVPGPEGREYARISKRGEVDVVVSTVPPDDLQSLPAVDVREYVATTTYTGPTKKGIRFPWEKLPEVVALLKAQARRMATEEGRQKTLFTQSSSRRVETADVTKDAMTDTGRPIPDSILKELLPNGLKAFPQEFLADATCPCSDVSIPVEPIQALQQADGRHVVRSDLGFSHCIRNPVEGNYILYAYMRGHRVVPVPTEMIHIFKAVKSYENYARELRHALVLAYEKKSGYRPAAEHQARELFRMIGLPWI